MTFLSKVYYSEMLTTKLDSKEKPQGLYSAVAHVYTIQTPNSTKWPVVSERAKLETAACQCTRMLQLQGDSPQPKTRHLDGLR